MGRVRDVSRRNDLSGTDRSVQRAVSGRKEDDLGKGRRCK